MLWQINTLRCQQKEPEHKGKSMMHVLYVLHVVGTHFGTKQHQTVK